MKEVKLPSGALLKIGVSPFPEARALYQAILKETVSKIQIRSDQELSEIYKQLFCLGFTSPEIEKCLFECLKRCTYNSGNGDLKISNDTFEPVEAREDYFTVCAEVAKEVVTPFTKSLYAEFSRLIAMITQSQA